MNILQAIEVMRRGGKVRRPAHVGSTVARCYLTIGFEEEADDDPLASVRREVIYFHADAIEGGWVQQTKAVRNEWRPLQSDLFSDDWESLQ